MWQAVAGDKAERGWAGADLDVGRRQQGLDVLLHVLEEALHPAVRSVHGGAADVHRGRKLQHVNVVAALVNQALAQAMGERATKGVEWWADRKGEWEAKSMRTWRAVSLPSYRLMSKVLEYHETMGPWGSHTRSMPSSCLRPKGRWETRGHVSLGSSKEPRARGAGRLRHAPSPSL